MRAVRFFAGYAVFHHRQVGIALVMATDISAQAKFMAACGAAMMIISLTWLLCLVSEGAQHDRSDGRKAPDKTSFLATIYAMQKNGPYLNCMPHSLHTPCFSVHNF